MKKIFLSAILIIVSSFAFSQSILTASDFFKSISDYYATIKDYEADMSIDVGKTNMTAKVSFMRPEMLRIDFSNPANQVILFNGDDLKIYLPGSSAILEQNASSSGGANLATPQGLNLMKRYYSISYVTGQDPVPLDEGSDQMVVNLILYRRNTTESFKQIKLSIDPKLKLILRVEAITTQNQTFQFDFSNYKLNTDMSEQRFIYDPPSSANDYSNFLFSE